MIYRILKVSLLIAVFLLAVYLSLPTPGFPPPLPGSVQSDEPADTESTYRRAYYTDVSRQEVIGYYLQEFKGPLQFKLNYPPEEAYALIRDQTRSSFLEEIILPGKSSLFINGYTPVLPQDALIVGGRSYKNKITVRLIPSHPVTRLTALGLAALGSLLLLKEYVA